MEPLADDDEKPGVWELRKDDTLLGRLEETEQDFPWVECWFIPTADFTLYEEYFVHPRTLRGWDLFRKLQQEGFNVISAEGHQLTAFTIMVRGDHARLTFTPV